MTSTQPAAGIGVLAKVQEDHREIERMLAGVQAATGDGKEQAFDQLVRKLAVHETAEEEIVHPLGKEVGADNVVEQRLAEEDEAKKALSELDGMSVTSPDFDTRFEVIREKVLAHAQREEQEEHPRIMAGEPADKLERLTSLFEAAERTAPTHPHAAAPESRAGNIVMGPIMSLIDRTRDAIRDAKGKMTSD